MYANNCIISETIYYLYNKYLTAHTFSRLDTLVRKISTLIVILQLEVVEKAEIYF